MSTYQQRSTNSLLFLLSKYINPKDARLTSDNFKPQDEIFPNKLVSVQSNGKILPSLIPVITQFTYSSNSAVSKQYVELLLTLSNMLNVQSYIPNTIEILDNRDRSDIFVHDEMNNADTNMNTINDTTRYFITNILNQPQKFTLLLWLRDDTNEQKTLFVLGDDATDTQNSPYIKLLRNEDEQFELVISFQGSSTTFNINNKISNFSDLIENSGVFVGIDFISSQQNIGFDVVINDTTITNQDDFNINFPTSEPITFENKIEVFPLSDGSPRTNIQTLLSFNDSSSDTRNTRNIIYGISVTQISDLIRAILRVQRNTLNMNNNIVSRLSIPTNIDDAVSVRYLRIMSSYKSFHVTNDGDDPKVEKESGLEQLEPNVSYHDGEYTLSLNIVQNINDNISELVDAEDKLDIDFTRTHCTLVDNDDNMLRTIEIKSGDEDKEIKVVIKQLDNGSVTKVKHDFIITMYPDVTQFDSILFM